MATIEDEVTVAPENVVAFGKERLHWRNLVFSLAVTAVLSGFLYLRIDLDELKDGFSRASYPLLAPVVLLLAFGWVLRGLRWGVLLSTFKAVPPFALFRLVMIGSAISAVVPARAGEFWRAHALGRQEGLSRSTAFGTIVIERLIDGLVLAMLASVSALAIGPSTSLAVLIGSMMTIFCVALVLVALLAHSERAQRLVTRMAMRVIPDRHRPVLEVKMSLFVYGLSVLKDNRTLLVSILLSVLIYSVDMSSYWVLGMAFDLHVNLFYYMLVVAVGNLAIAVPISIGGIGPFEFFVQQTLVLLGVSSAPGLIFALFIHTLTLGFVVITGLLLVWTSLSRVAPQREVAPHHT